MQPVTVTVARAEFTRPVEHIMRCDDFKSNFARKLSTRYTNTHSPTPAPRIVNKADVHDNSLNNSVPCDEISASVRKPEELGDGNCATVNVVEDAGADAGVNGVRLQTLSMEVDTLRWQLTQTEANRQMHIALLRQVVSFLSRVKEHIEFQKEKVARTSAGELSRARSVLHLSAPVSTSLAHPLARANRSISSADAGTWNNSMLIIPPENHSNQKMSEEISRLVCLANTVLGTKLPELSCCCTDKNEERTRAETRKSHESFHTDDITTPISLIKDPLATDTIGNVAVETTTKSLNMIEKRNDYEQYSFIEDESGFSSMSSFQEIGIPIISIIPASPCEEVCAGAAAPTEQTDEEEETSPTSTAAAVHVFWV